RRVGREPAVNHLGGCADRRPGPLRIRLPRRRHRRGKRLPHRPPVHLMPTGQLPDRRALDPAVLPDLLEQLHSRPRHSRTSAPATSTQRSEPWVGPELVTTRRPPPDAITTQAGPAFAKNNVPAGASSGDHTHGGALALDKPVVKE